MANTVAGIWSTAEQSPERVAVRSAGRQLSYGELRDRIAHSATGFAERGVIEGDRVLLIAPSVAEFVIAYYALQTIGATTITMNVMSTSPEIDYVIDDSGTTLVVAWHECAENPRRSAQSADLPFVEIRPFHETPDDHAPIPAYVDRADDAISVILYTSGTTGRPKGAELTVANINACPVAFRQLMQVTPDDRWATALPLFHVFGQAIVMNSALSQGCSLSLLSPFSPTAFLDMLRDEQITIACGVPTMWNAMLQVADGYSPEDFTALRLAGSGGAALPAEVIRAFETKFGCKILEGYGLTETAGAATFHDMNGVPVVGTVGPALPGTQVEVRDPDGGVVATDVVGEIFIKGPTVMKGYWNRPDATAAELVDGWFKTGDLGSMDVAGNVRIVDRVKDLIIRGGYNVYPREVEEVLYEHPDIVEAAVVGVPDEHYGEEIAAVIAPRSGAEIDPDALREWAKERLSAYKVPRIVAFVDALPKGATGKILKRAIDREVLRTVAH
ncbi:AMP-binding protein [Gordonia rhizosphera]|uniref:Putative fatty-acid--CoA ligase n=1 Tax=Gordonia rhizosphera NBRC 16068 TaxID=1108045 RepID=K6WH57_9ACTN|nr:AMP-binding protein [Gordonia rhizosphera]GAB91492.1 putative fatty-acid--CoA ligase [Gordonia rhizosphera NBRC 16068]